MYLWEYIVNKLSIMVSLDFHSYFQKNSLLVDHVRIFFTNRRLMWREFLFIQSQVSHDKCILMLNYVWIPRKLFDTLIFDNFTSYFISYFLPALWKTYALLNSFHWYLFYILFVFVSFIFCSYMFNEIWSLIFILFSCFML